MKKIEWYAICSKSASGSKENAGLEYINVIRDYHIESVKKLIKKNASYDEIKKDLDSWFMHDYWSKCEYEVIVSNWTGYDFERKIDVYYQIQPNLDRITEYMIREIAPRKCKEILKRK